MGATRGLYRRLSKFARHERVVIDGGADATPAYEPLYIFPTAAPTVTGVKGSIYFDSTLNNLQAHNGTAYAAIAALGDRAVTAVTAATLAPTAADSGRIYELSRAAGIDVTLPAAVAGMEYEFVVRTSVTSNDYSITAATGDLLWGGLFSIDTDTSNAVAYFPADGSDDLIISMNGTTTGGLVRTHIRVLAVAADRWHVSGVNFGSGIVATPFS